MIKTSEDLLVGSLINNQLLVGQELIHPAGTTDKLSKRKRLIVSFEGHGEREVSSSAIVLNARRG